MPFSSAIAEELLVKAHRHCCICHEPAGSKMQIHHIIPQHKGGDDSAANGIPLCFDCHAEVESYNPQHPLGRRFTPSELRKHRDQWFAITSSAHWQRAASAPAVAPSQSVRSLLNQLADAQLWNPDNDCFLGSVRALVANERDALVAGLIDTVAMGDEDARWNAAIVVEFLVQWDPQRIPDELLSEMATDDFFGIRTNAAVSFYYLAGSSPDRVPVEALRELAQFDEDWYVMTPAMSALRRLARTRPVAVEIMVEGAQSEDESTAERYAHELRQLVREYPAAANWTAIQTLEKDARPFVREVGMEWREILERRIDQQLGNDLGIF